MSNQNQTKIRTTVFVSIMLISLSIGAIYVGLAAYRPSSIDLEESFEIGEAGERRAKTSQSSAEVHRISTRVEQQSSSLEQRLRAPSLVSLNSRSGPNIGRIQLTSLLDPSVDPIYADLRCERVDHIDSRGICLSRKIEQFDVNTVVTLFDHRFEPQQSFWVEGIPSRTRISPNGQHAVLTTFVFGHSYADSEFSTATLLIDAETAIPLANLESFTVFHQGQVIDYPDFNYWGVTFSRDGRTFYATLRFNRTPYLVRGDIDTRTITVLHPHVECPSLSPDETRVVFKKLTANGHWQLTIMDLATLRETPLAETRSVDDQAEWLDNDHVLYTVAISNPSPSFNIYLIAADGSGEPELYVEGATSPSVYRQ
ncbi:MAG: hypothetical protein AAF629_15750 [Chloroflexota bacterium]